MSCAKIKSSKYKLCASDLKNRIIVQYPSSISSNSPGVNGLSTFIDILNPWCKIVTTNGQQISIGQVNTSASSTIDFYIRYDAALDLDREIWVLYNNKRYEIIAPENIDERNLTIRLGAVLKGPSSVEANQR